MTLVRVRCPLCNKELEVGRTAEVTHFSCPLKKPRSHPPVYKRVEEAK